MAVPRTKFKVHARSWAVAAVVVGAAAVASFFPIGSAGAGAHHSFLGGPWELVVKMGLEGDGLRFPLAVSDETKPQKFDVVLPVTGTSIRVKLEEYLPDLAWETVAVEDPNGDIVAKLAIKGKNMEQNIWLSPGDPARQSISSRVGGVAIRRFHNPDTAEAMVRELTHPKAVGILSVWPEQGGRPFECVAKVGQKVVIPGSAYKLTVLEYLPHYSIDTETKKVVSQSDKPVNPALKVALSDGQKTSEQWLWSKFPSSPHEQGSNPLHIRYTDFDLGDDKGAYILAVAGGTKAWLFLSNNKGKRAEKVVLGRYYPFADKQYAFSLEKVMDGAIVRTEWRNNSERLLRPAFVATIEESGESEQTVLQLDTPFHHKTKSGVLVLLYKRSPAPAESP
jgi:hypothetical protein